jgi:hypothetical protein
MADNAVGVTYHRLHHFLTQAPWDALIDAGYGNNTTFLLSLENRKLKYLGGLAKNRKVITRIESNKGEEIRLDKLAQSLSVEDFTPVQLNLDKPKTV